MTFKLHSNLHKFTICSVPLLSVFVKQDHLRRTYWRREDVQSERNRSETNVQDMVSFSSWKPIDDTPASSLKAMAKPSPPSKSVSRRHNIDAGQGTFEERIRRWLRLYHRPTVAEWRSWRWTFDRLFAQKIGFAQRIFQR